MEQKTSEPAEVSQPEGRIPYGAIAIAVAIAAALIIGGVVVTKHKRDTRVEMPQPHFV